MKIRLSDISSAGLTVNDTIPLEPLNDRMAFGRGSEIIFSVAPAINLAINPTSDGAEAKGTVKSKYRQPCSLCLKELDKDISVEINLILKPRPPAEERSPNDDFDGDVGIVYYDDGHVDLEEVVQEILILALSLYWHPPLDAKGACTGCGLTKKELGISEEPKGASLGELLKKAGVSNN